jgi:hypothetical protein
MPTWQHILTCACGCERTGAHEARGLLPGCYTRAFRAGRLDDYPPHPMSLDRRRVAAARMVQGKQAARDGRLEDYIELRSWGLSRREAAARVGVTLRTTVRWHHRLRAQGATYKWLPATPDRTTDTRKATAA